MYIAGQLRELDSVLFEGLCLVEGLRRLGFSVGEQIRVRIERADGGKNSLFPERTRRGDFCLFVELRASRKTEIFALLGAREDGAQLEDEIVWRGCVGPMTAETYEREFARGVRLVDRAAAFEAEPLWQASRARKMLPGLEEVLKMKGFEVRL